jgi:hypothetical protein
LEATEEVEEADSAETEVDLVEIEVDSEGAIVEASRVVVEVVTGKFGIPNEPRRHTDIPAVAKASNHHLPETATRRHQEAAGVTSVILMVEHLRWVVDLAVHPGEGAGMKTEILSGCAIELWVRVAGSVQ